MCCLSMEHLPPMWDYVWTKDHLKSIPLVSTVPHLHGGSVEEYACVIDASKSDSDQPTAAWALMV